ncbi:hypothetical protein BCR39DRAFT_556026 [Naematelia encephala]|uniref:Glycosyltransferase family 32 protein n=1 Tax=Naematelia encephala TaxID=71784 RepID=A0A1Y2BMC5_9TREE|nr:hypothetical protein BCR39DRAFT_556026 [Naematelia encephala]
MLVDNRLSVRPTLKIVLAVLISATILLHLSSTSSSSSLYRHLPLKILDATIAKTVDLDWITKQYEYHLSLIRQKTWNVDRDHNVLFLNGLDEGREAYIDRLETFVGDYFPPKQQENLIAMLNRLKSGISPPLPAGRELPKTVFTNDKESIPDVFKGWMETHQDWEFQINNDDGMDDFITKYMGGSRFQHVFNRLPRPIFKSDIIRYLYLLLHGGIYTDSDTAPVAHALTWGHDPIPMLSPVLSALQSLMISGYDRLSSALPPLGERTGAILHPGISTIVSLEYNAIQDDRDKTIWEQDQLGWKRIFPRATQVVQYTMMSKPWHPIYLDVLYHTIMSSEDLEEQTEAGKMGIHDWPGALNLTGPGPFTDAVFRYLQVQYGYNPRDAPAINAKAQVIGDVV